VCREAWSALFQRGKDPTVPAPVISVKDASKRYGAVVAVDRVSLTVDAGQIYALLGLNGAGKTTLIRMLLGMLRPTAGCVALWGRPVGAAATSLWSSVGYLVETPMAYPELTVRENLQVVRRLRRLPTDQPVDEVIERLQLTGYADRRAGTLSLGNSQRLGLAKALLHRADLLILDEPANGLDPAGVVEVRELLTDLVDRHGTTILLSSHVLAEVSRLATRIGILHQGQLVKEVSADGITGEVRHWLSVSTRDNAAARATLEESGFVVESDGDELRLVDEPAVRAAEDVATVLVRTGCPPTRLVVEREDLETYFLRTVGHTAAHDA
jgi:ABC-2 type transport system ATP-binding protein